LGRFVEGRFAHAKGATSGLRIAGEPGNERSPICVLNYRHGCLLIRQQRFQEAIQGAMQKAGSWQGIQLPEANG